MVLDPRAEDALVIIRTNLFGAGISNTLSKESGDIVWFHSEDYSADDLIIKRFEIFLLAEHNVGCAFNLLDSPCITESRRFRNRTVSSGKNIKNLVEPLRVNTVRKFLGSLYLGDFKEGIVLHPVNDLFFCQAYRPEGYGRSYKTEAGKAAM